MYTEIALSQLVKHFVASACISSSPNQRGLSQCLFWFNFLRTNISKYYDFSESMSASKSVFNSNSFSLFAASSK